MMNFFKPKLLGLTVVTIISLSSCKKNPSLEVLPEIVKQAEVNVKIKYQKEFSKALAKTLKNEPLVRELLKIEALKQFDNDNDVLFQMVMNAKLSDGESRSRKLQKYGVSEEELNHVLNHSPTITILVPELPDFSPQSWDTKSQIPAVALDPVDRYEDVEIFYADGTVSEMPVGRVPAFPVVVVKENERVNVKVKGIDKSPASSVLLKSGNQVGKVFFKNNSSEFTFSNEAFNGLSPATKLNTIFREDREGDGDDLGPELKYAFENNLEWHRDYIYYGIDPSKGVTKGPFRSNFKEYITHIKMLYDDYFKVGDQPQTGDAQPTKLPYFYRGSITPIPPQASLWTDGYFDIRVNILINSSNGVGQVLNQVYTIPPSELFWINYATDPNAPQRYYVNTTAKEYKIPKGGTPIDSWNLENYGGAWKFTISEYDLSEETTVVKFNKSTFGTNFEINASTGEKFKVGAKFGVSATNESSASYTYKSTATSDDLGEGVLNFGDPIIISKEVRSDGRSRPTYYTYYKTWDVNTGSVLLSVEPRKIN